MADDHEDSFYLELEQACLSLSVAEGKKSASELQGLFDRLRRLGVGGRDNEHVGGSDH